jgi:putrescine transport system permease protein
VLEKFDWTVLEAAADLGAKPLRAFFRVTLPLSLPGIFSGVLLVFIPALGEFIVPELLGGPDTLMAGRVLWTEFFSNRDWPLAAALAIGLLVLILIPAMAMFRLTHREERA